MTPYLIQRAKFEDDKTGKGIDTILAFAYMGSSAFEWGALPQSLARIRANIIHYAIFDTTVKGKELTVFTDSNPAHVTEYLKVLARPSTFLKERSDFDSYINPSEYDLQWQSKRGHDTDFWWDIENDIMFWKKNKRFETQFEILITKKP